MSNRAFIDIGLPAELARAQTMVPDIAGVLVQDHRSEEIQWIDGAREAVRWANDNGYYTFVVTNQAGVRLLRRRSRPGPA